MFQRVFAVTALLLLLVAGVATLWKRYHPLSMREATSLMCGDTCRVSPGHQRKNVSVRLGKFPIDKPTTSTVPRDESPLERVKRERLDVAGLATISTAKDSYEISLTPVAQADLRPPGPATRGWNQIALTIGADMQITSIESNGDRAVAHVLVQEPLTPSGIALAKVQNISENSCIPDIPAQLFVCKNDQWFIRQGGWRQVSLSENDILNQR